MPRHTQIHQTISILHGAVNCGFLRQESSAILIDCCDTITPTILNQLDVTTVEKILLTQYRRPNASGILNFPLDHIQVITSEDDKSLVDSVDHYWANWKNRWHIYSHQPGPLVLHQPVPVSHTVKDGDIIEWGDKTITVLATPGATHGAVSYLIEIDQLRICFCGDLIYAGGKLWDLYSLQKGKGNYLDYHGFLGNKENLLRSLDRIRDTKPNILVSSHGPIIDQPEQAIDTLIQRLESLWSNYTSISSVNHYFPDFFEDNGNTSSKSIISLPTHKLPDCVKQIGYTSFGIIAEDKSLFLIDCGHDLVVHRLQNMLSRGQIRAVEGCWVTHYHDDHVDSLGRLSNEFNCPIMTEAHMADVILNPSRYYLPCISPNAAPLSKIFQHGESWQWHEFKFTAFHFPGQTLYHSGLLVERLNNGHDKKAVRIFFAGDSGSPTGIDDYCPANRTFLGKGVGFRFCIEIWRQIQPGHILNQHQNRSFSFSSEALDEIEQTLIEREDLLRELLPWENPNFGLDENWVRTYPYEQTVFAGSRVAIDVQITNHASEPIAVSLEPVIPPKWSCSTDEGSYPVIPAKTAGMVGKFIENPDFRQRFWLEIPKRTAAGKYIIPFRLTWNSRYLGQFRHAIVNIIGE